MPQRVARRPGTAQARRHDGILDGEHGELAAVRRSATAASAQRLTADGRGSRGTRDGCPSWATAPELRVSPHSPDRSPVQRHYRALPYKTPPGSGGQEGRERGRSAPVGPRQAAPRRATTGPPHRERPACGATSRPVGQRGGDGRRRGHRAGHRRRPRPTRRRAPSRPPPPPPDQPRPDLPRLRLTKGGAAPNPPPVPTSRIRLRGAPAPRCPDRPAVEYSTVSCRVSWQGAPLFRRDVP